MGQIQTLREFLSLIRRRLPIIILVSVIGVVFSLVYAFSQNRVYEATAIVQIQGAQVTDSLTRALANTSGAQRVQQIEQRVMARDNVLKFIELHNLFNDVPDMTETEQVEAFRQSTQITGISAPGAGLGALSSPTALLISVQTGDADLAADLANEIANDLIAQDREKRSRRNEGALRFFQDEAIRLNRSISALEAEIAGFKTENAQALPEGLTGIRDLVASIEQGELEIDQQIIALQNELSTPRRARDNERRIELLEEQKKGLVSRRSELQIAIDAAPEVERKFSLLSRRLTELQEQYAVITRSRSEAELAQQLEVNQQSERLELLETAIVPDWPIAPNRKKLAAMGTIASVGLAFGLVYLLEIMRPVIRNPAQMERQVGLRPVVSIPYVRTKSERLRKYMLYAVILMSFIVSLPLILTVVDRFVMPLDLVEDGTISTEWLLAMRDRYDPALRAFFE